MDISWTGTLSIAGKNARLAVLRAATQRMNPDLAEWARPTA